MSKNFLDNLKSYGIGSVERRMDELQAEIVEAVRDTGLKGNLRLDLSFVRKGHNGIVVAAKITPKIPESQIQSVEMFVDEKNRLYEENPDQLDFENVHHLNDKKTVNKV